VLSEAEVTEAAELAAQDHSLTVDKYLKVRAENSIKQSKFESLKTKREIDDVQRQMKY
jgi:hypothetical protein